jgi:hypothetical protein
MYAIKYRPSDASVKRNSHQHMIQYIGIPQTDAPEHALLKGALGEEWKPKSDRG